MNKQKAPGGIEWTRVWGRPGYTWNPTAGCEHNCKWTMPDGSVAICYAKSVAENVAAAAFPQGFEHHYFHPQRLEEPTRVQEPSGIFVGSMADLFGHWVPDEQIEAVIQVMRDTPQHIYMTLSKYPVRLEKFNPYPNNVWVGMSVVADHDFGKLGVNRAMFSYLRYLHKADAQVRWISIEPLWFDVAEVFADYLRHEGHLPFEWAVIGAASNGKKRYPPDPKHVAKLLSLLDEQGIPVFFKGNMSCAEFDGPWRAEFPPELYRKSRDYQVADYYDIKDNDPRFIYQHTAWEYACTLSKKPNIDPMEPIIAVWGPTRLDALVVNGEIFTGR